MFFPAQIDFGSEQVNPHAQVTLPASLLSNVPLSEADRSTLSRINFIFFNNTNLFQVRTTRLDENEVSASRYSTCYLLTLMYLCRGSRAVAL